eukprot:3781438-Amphidinium_carterae.1
MRLSRKVEWPIRTCKFLGRLMWRLIKALLSMDGVVKLPALWTGWDQIAQAVAHFLWNPNCDRPEYWHWGRLPAPVPEPVHASVSPIFPTAFEVGPHKRLVEHATFAECLDCRRQVARVL